MHLHATRMINDLPYRAERVLEEIVVCLLGALAVERLRGVDAIGESRNLDSCPVRGAHGALPTRPPRPGGLSSVLWAVWAGVLCGMRPTLPVAGYIPRVLDFGS